ncbi:tetratricopeptide repeat protein [bacterium]|nr:tetratricopeptide repeat protein [bacterium]
MSVKHICYGCSILAMVFFLMGCTTNRPKLSDVQTNLNDMNQRIDRNEQEYQEVRTSRNAILDRMKQLIETEVPSMTERTQLMHPNESDIKSQPPSSPPQPFKEPDVQENADTLELFRQANAKFNKGKYTEAAQEYSLVYEYAVTQDIKARSLYRLGNSHYNNKDFEKAIRIFTRLEYETPDHPILSSALLKKGYAQIFQGFISEGKQTLGFLIDRYPNTTEAALAQERLKELGNE